MSTIFQRVEVFCGSELLESINNYDHICSMFLDCQVSPIDSIYGWNCTKETCNYSILSSNALTNTITGTSILETSPYNSIPLEAFQERLWHPIYLWAEGECIQLNIYMSDQQIRDLDTSLAAFSNFTLHAMTFYTQKTSSRLQ